MFVLRPILEQPTEWNSNLFALFIDFEKAFQSRHREILFKVLKYVYGYVFQCKLSSTLFKFCTGTFIAS